MISETQLLDFEYYLRRMSMFMNEAHGFNERTRILWNLLTAIDNFYDKLFEFYDVLDVAHEKGDKYNISDNINSEVLDRIGALFDCKRSMMIKYGTPGDEHYALPRSMSDLTTTKYITLTDKDYLTFIKMSIKKQYFNGTREELAALYYAEDVAKATETDYMQFYYVTRKNLEDTDNQPAEVDLYWSNAGSNTSMYSTDLRYMFLNGLLTIESMGISYSRSIQSITKIALFATLDFEPTFVLANPQPTADDFELNPYYTYIQPDTQPASQTDIDTGKYYIYQNGQFILATTYVSSETYYIRILVTSYDADYAGQYYTISNNTNNYGIFDFSLWG